jgi:hypothetical protein
MFDCNGPLLVLNTPTYHPVLEHHTGYIFDYYEFHFYKPREMFFSHIFEAQVFALYRKARLELDPAQKPETVTAVDYILSAESYDERMPEGGNTGLAGVRQRPGHREPEQAPPARLTEPWEPEDIPEIDWFGE